MIPFIEKVNEKYLNLHNTLAGGTLGEIWGTFMLIVFGLGVILQVELGSKVHGSFLSISLGWGFAVMLAVFWGGKLGHGHVNPAVTLGFATIGKIEWIRVPCYILGQVFGAYLGALILFIVYYEKLKNYEKKFNNGSFTMDKTGGMFITRPSGSTVTAFIDQFFGTFLLASCALAITDVNGFNLPDYHHPFLLGLMVATLVGCFALNAGAALNPARDFGPRLMLAMCGWGKAAFSNSRYYFWVPIMAPFLGGVIGSIFYYVCIGMHLKSASSSGGKVGANEN